MVNASGYGAGTASRFSEENGDIGQSTWLWDGNDTIRIGLTDAEHTRGSTGEQESELEAINDQGDVLGQSNTFDEESWTGFSAWIYDGDQTIRIGFYTEDFLDEDGGPKARPIAMNNAGEVAGVSQVYRDTDNGKSTFGERAWLYRDNGTIVLGLTDDEHRNTEPDHDHFGRMESEPFAINDAGQVIGNSRRYDEDSTTGSTGAHGMSAWIYDIEAEVHTRIGFTDATHTGDDGFQDSSILGGSEIRPLNQSGQVIGRSRRFIADHWQERTAWIYDSETDSLQRLGLTGGDYIDDDGFESSIARVLNDAGYVVGRSWVVSDGRDGRDVWLFDGEESLRIGLYDDLHSSTTDDRNNNTARNHFVLNESAQVVGWADQYDGDEATGQSGWFYDHNEGKTHELIFEMPESGTGHTIPEVVFENGLVRGTYTRYSDGGFQQESHEFLWTVDNGFFTIDDLLTEDLDTDGVEWLKLRSMRWMLNDGSIVGSGRLSDEDGDWDPIQPFLLRTVNY